MMDIEIKIVEGPTDVGPSRYLSLLIKIKLAI